MKTTSKIRRLLLLAIPACALASCASFEDPLVRHDLDGDGFISPSEYHQKHAQYDMADRQRRDEYSRARLVTEHAANVNDFLYQARGVVSQIHAF